MFGRSSAWRKEASRCKKLIKRVQCRLTLLKNKRCSIVRHLRDDVAQLLKLGHEQSASNKVEQIFLDESIIGAYDWLDFFCEFVILNLSYIRKHKDCPNDIGEAVSSLIFASARCGDLPELWKIRKLFGERYGEKFELDAVELRPGNLVNKQIKENLSIKSVPVHVKAKLVNEIAESCLKAGPLAFEPQIQENQTRMKLGDMLKIGVQSDNHPDHEPQMHGSNNSTTSTCSSMVLNPSPCSFNWLVSSEEEPRVTTYTLLNSPYEVDATKHKEANMDDEDSSTESSSQRPNELVYLDDIEEYESSMSTHVNFQDQRIFMNKLEDGLDEGYTEKSSSLNENSCSRRSDKSKKALGKRQRRRSLSPDITSVKDFEAKVYYGESEEHSRKFHRQRKHQKKIQACYFCKGNIVKSSAAPKNVVRSTSLPAHVHPKLPDYDDLAATLTVLKKANLQIKSSC